MIHANEIEQRRQLAIACFNYVVSHYEYQTQCSMGQFSAEVCVFSDDVEELQELSRKLQCFMIDACSREICYLDKCKTYYMNLEFIG